MSAVARFQEVRKSYPGRIEVLEGVDLSIDDGEAVGLIGPNGAGKTTIIKLLLGLLRPTSGSVKLWGHEAYTLPIELRQRISFLLEEPGVYGNLTVEENLLFWARLYDVERRRVSEMLETWDLLGKKRKPARTLSAGMKQRLRIAAALIHDASLSVLDEPTSNLDPEARKAVVQLLRDHGEGRTLFVSSHDLSDMERVCTRLVLLRRGAIAAQGSMEQLKQQLGVKRTVRIRVSGTVPDDLKRRLVDSHGATQAANAELVITDDAADIRELVRLLVEEGIGVERVEEDRTTLEDVYTAIVKEDESA